MEFIRYKKSVDKLIKILGSVRGCELEWVLERLAYE
jgi:hypothetical protein